MTQSRPSRTSYPRRGIAFAWVTLWVTLATILPADAEAIARSMSLAALASSPADAETPSPPAWFQVVHHDGQGDALYVGRLGWPTTHIHSSSGPIRASGPVDGWIIAWWREGSSSVVDAVQTYDGDYVEIARFPEPILAASLAPDGRSWFWVTRDVDARVGHLWRQHVHGAFRHVVEVVGDIPIPVARMAWTADGRRLALSSRTGSGYRYDVVDIRTSEHTSIVGAYGPLVGYLGYRLVAATEGNGGSLTLPVFVVDALGGAPEILASGPGGTPSIVPTPLGDELAWAAPTPDGRYGVFARGPDAEVPRLVWSSAEPWGAALGRVVDVSDGLAAVEVPGSVPVFPAARLLWRGRPSGFGDPGGLLVALDGSRVDSVSALQPPPAPIGLRWTPTLNPPPGVERVVFDVVAYRGGFLAIGWEGRQRAWMVWHSTDGRRWRHTPFPYAPAADVFSGPTRLYARGRFLIATGQSEDERRVAIWASHDGRTWARVPDTPNLGIGRVKSPEVAASHAWVTDVGFLNGNYVIAADFGIEGTYASRIWFWRDARHWVRHRTPRSNGRATYRAIERVTVGRGRLLGMESSVDGDHAVASEDGEHWTRIGHWPGDQGLLEWVHEGEKGFLAIGQVTDGGPLITWRSRDARRWTRADVEPGWDASAVAARGHSIVVLGARRDPMSDVGRQGALVSVDGTRWEPSLGWFGPVGSRPDAIAIRGRVVVAVGDGLGGRWPAGWRAVLPSPDRE